MPLNTQKNIPLEILHMLTMFLSLASNNSWSVWPQESKNTTHSTFFDMTCNEVCVFW